MISINEVIQMPDWNRRTDAQIKSVLEIVNDFLDANSYEYEYEVDKNITFKEPTITYKILFFDIMKLRGDYDIIRRLSHLISGASIGAFTDGYVDIKIGITV